MRGLIREEREYILKKLNELASIYWQESESTPMIRFLECLIKEPELNKQEFLELEALSWDTRPQEIGQTHCEQAFRSLGKAMAHTEVK